MYNQFTIEDENPAPLKKTLKIQSQLGSGNFGKIHLATAYGLDENEDAKPVAVKRVKNSKNSQECQQLAREWEILTRLGNGYTNVIGFLGAVKSEPNAQLIDAVILEYCPYGDLRSYLVQNRCRFVDQIDYDTDRIDPHIKHTRAELRYLQMFTDSSASNYINVQPPHHSYANVLDSRCETPQSSPDLSLVAVDQPLTTSTLVSWSRQIAGAMAFVHAKRVLHCDLAARNIVLTANNIVKICDFGLATEWPLTDACAIRDDTPLPWKWASLECLRSRVFTSRSDVWSYGVCLWELFSLGQLPYANVEDESALLGKLNMGWRLDKPSYTTEAIHNLMMECWNEKAEDRPEFGYLEKWFADLEESKGNE